MVISLFQILNLVVRFAGVQQLLQSVDHIHLIKLCLLKKGPGHAKGYFKFWNILY